MYRATITRTTSTSVYFKHPSVSATAQPSNSHLGRFSFFSRRYFAGATIIIINNVPIFHSDQIFLIIFCRGGKIVTFWNPGFHWGESCRGTDTGNDGLRVLTYFCWRTMVGILKVGRVYLIIYARDMFDEIWTVLNFRGYRLRRDALNYLFLRKGCLIVLHMCPLQEGCMPKAGVGYFLGRRRIVKASVCF